MKRMFATLQRDQDGGIAVLVAIFLMGLVAITGLVADGGYVFVQRRDLQDVADAAAAAGAMQLSEASYRSADGAQVALDPGSARATAIAYLAGADVGYAVDADASQVQVNVTRNAPTAFLRVLGIDNVPIAAHAIAMPRYGVSGGTP